MKSLGEALGDQKNSQYLIGRFYCKTFFVTKEQVEKSL